MRNVNAIVLHGRGDAITSKNNFLDRVIVREHGQNSFRIAASIRGGTRHARAVGGKRLRLFAAAVENRNRVPRAEQIARHAHAHSAESDECNFHSRQHSDSAVRNQVV